LTQQGRSQFGLVAEEVEQVNPDLIVRDKEGKPNSVRYDQVNTMLLNKFLKEHKRIEEQQATIAELKSEMTALTVTVQEQSLRATASKNTNANQKLCSSDCKESVSDRTADH
jgi:hypothetical protein